MPAPPPHAVEQELRGLAAGDDRRFSEATLAYLRACGPALDHLAGAARAEAFTRPAGEATHEAAPVDLMQPRRLALTALAMARLDARGGAPALAARWPLRLIRLGRTLARGAPAFEAAACLELSRLGEAALERSLTRSTRWSEPELRWLQRELAGLPDSVALDPSLLAASPDSPSEPRPSGSDAEAPRPTPQRERSHAEAPPDPAPALLALADRRREALAALRRRCQEALAERALEPARGGAK